jgi:DHA3 family macrolide efflux protein-like MFS transporter
VGILLPFYVEDFLGARTDWFGFLLAAQGVGSLAGFILAGSLKISGRIRSRLIIFCIFAMASLVGVLGLIRNPFIAIAMFLLIGVLSGMANIYIITILQLTTPSGIRGRVFGLLGTISAGITPIAMGMAGIVADLMDHNIPFIYGFCGVTTALLSLLVSLSRDYREYLAYEPVRPSAETEER